MTTYVNAYAFFVAIMVLVGCCAGAVVLYGENQNTQNLIKTLTTDFETKMINITMNNSILMSSLVTDFQAKIATATTQIETLATAKGSLENQVATLTINMGTLQTSYNNQQSNLLSLNSTWANFTKLLNKGQKKLLDAKNSLPRAQYNFTLAKTLFDTNVSANYTRAIQNSTKALTNYNQSRIIFNASNSAFNSALNKATQSWTDDFVMRYINLQPMVLTMTSEMIQTNLYLINASQWFIQGNLTNWNISKTTMNTHLSLYTIAYDNYVNSTKAIDVFLGTL